MLIFRDHKIIFIHVPKTGGSTITAALCGSLTNNKLNTNKHGWQLKHHTLGKMHERISYLSRHKFKDYKVIGFVRNPWDWIASRYNVRGNGLTLKEFLITKIKWSLSDWLMTDVRCADFIGRFEHMQSDYNVLCDMYDIPKTEIMHLNKSNYSRDYKPYYNDETIDMVREHNIKVIDRFGYKF